MPAYGPLAIDIHEIANHTPFTDLASLLLGAQQQ